jgi:hypothetical protein
LFRSDFSGVEKYEPINGEHKIKSELGDRGEELFGLLLFQALDISVETETMVNF